MQEWSLMALSEDIRQDGAPLLSTCLAKALNTKTGFLPNSTIPAVWMRNKWVALPHLSYAQWPPHKYFNQPRPLINSRTAWEWRGTFSGASRPFKTASWLNLNAQMDFSGALKKKIGKGNKQGFVTLNGGKELLHEFWLTYANHLHRLGSLPLPERFFSALLDGLNDSYAEIVLLKQNDVTVGSAFNIYIDGFYENAWFATTPKAQAQYGSYVLHAFMIGRAKAKGAEVYSFGRSTTGSGVHQFKRQWNTVDVPLQWFENGMAKTGSYFLKRLGGVLRYIPFRFVAYLGARLYKFIY